MTSNLIEEIQEEMILGNQDLHLIQEKVNPTGNTIKTEKEDKLIKNPSII